MFMVNVEMRTGARDSVQILLGQWLGLLLGLGQVLGLKLVLV
jgi:hypothetical protein